MPESEATACARHASEIGSGRVGRSSGAEDPAHAAVVAHVRHEHTSYDTLLADGYSRDEARAEVAKAISAKLDEWKTKSQPTGG